MAADVEIKQTLPAQFITMFLQALTTRALQWVALLGAGAAWGYAMWQPEPLRLVAAVAYSAFVWLPLLLKKG